jgi:hypothetical protein
MFSVLRLIVMSSPSHNAVMDKALRLPIMNKLKGAFTNLFAHWPRRSITMSEKANASYSRRAVRDGSRFSNNLCGTLYFRSEERIIPKLKAKGDRLNKGTAT